MTGYVVFWILLLGTGIIKNEQKMLVVLFVIITLFSAIRYGIGYDYYSYLEGCTWGSSKADGWEPIPRFLAIISQNSIPFLFFAITSVIISLFYYLGIKKSGIYYFEEVAFYLSFPFLFMNQLGIVRQGMATAIVFYALTLGNNDLYKKILLLILAILCHLSAVVAVFILFPWNKISRPALWAMFLGSFVLGKAIVPIVLSFVNYGFLGDIGTSKAEGYLTGDYAGEGGLISYLIYFISFVLLVFYNNLVKINPRNKYYIGCIILGVALFAMFSFNISLAKRFCMFFFSAAIIVIPQLSKQLKIPRFTYLFTCIVLFALTIYVGSGNQRDEDPPGYAVTYPYRTIFDVLGNGY